MAAKFTVNKDIRKAQTLPASFYRDPAVFRNLKEKVFYRSWQWMEGIPATLEPRAVFPTVLLKGFLDEPVVVTRAADGQYHCLSNVCTHRGNIVVGRPGPARQLVCGYHGRRFALDGAFEHMPEFKEAVDFPSDCDHLHRFSLRSWGPFRFAGLNPAFDLQQEIDAMNERVGFLPLDRLTEHPERHKEYSIRAHWALYCDNYLEGFHIPFVHEDLNAVLDYGRYETVLYDHMNLQIGYGQGSDPVFDLPKGHPDYGKQVAAYYFWLFPNTMFNFYPWGVSVNLVLPESENRTRVLFRTFVLDPSKLDRGAGSGLDKVELEDEAVVEGVHRGVRSRFYTAGRFSPEREQGVHHFHRLLATFVNA